jgi:hypothetical protein
MNVLCPAYRTKIPIGGQSVLIADTVLNYAGGYIVNPQILRDQLIQGVASTTTREIGQLNTYNYEFPLLPINGIQFVSETDIISLPESIFVSLTGPAILDEDISTTELAPGESFIVPPGTAVWVNAKTGGHAFTAFFIGRTNPNFPPVPLPSNIPTGPTGLLTAIPSYLYQEYTDDDDLQAFVATENQQQQNYVDTFNALNLPIYTGDIIAGALLDWVAEGVYGIKRPWISSGHSAEIGPLNTMLLNQSFIDIDGFQKSLIGPIILANDDVFKRVITWHYMKGDGKYCSVRWMKRRIMRFLIGTNGTSPPIDNTDQISISFGPDGAVGVRFINGQRTVIGGCMPNVFFPGQNEPIDNLDTNYVAFTPLPFIGIFSEALASGALEVPFQTNFSAVIG